MVRAVLSSENLKQKLANFLEVFEKIRMTSRPHYNTRKKMCFQRNGVLSLKKNILEN